MQQGTQQLGNAELWEALQRQQAANNAPGGFAAPLNGVPAMLASGGAGGSMQPLPGFVLADAGSSGGQQPLMLSGKQFGFGGGAGGGIGGLPSSLTSLPGMPYPSHSPPPTGQPGQPQLFGSGAALSMPMQMQLGSGGSGMPGTFAQSSGLGSQVSSAMALDGMGGSGLVPNHPAPTLQQLQAGSLTPTAHLPHGMAQQQVASQPLSLQQMQQQLQGMQGVQMQQPMVQHPMQQPMQQVQPGGGGAMAMGGMQLPPMPGIATQSLFKLEPDDPALPSSSHSVAVPMPVPGSPQSEEDEGEGDGDGSPADCMGSGGLNKSRYRGVSYDRKKAKWRVQIKVAALGKSGVSVGYFDTEEAAARAYDRAAIGLLGRDNPNLQTNFDARDYTGETIPPLTGKTREEVKTTLKSERIKQQAPRRRFTSRQRTSRFMGVGSSNRKNQWQARILVHGKVTHLGYYETEEEAARVYDKVSLALHGDSAQTNFPASNYRQEDVAVYSGLDREDLQRALGVKPMDKSSKYRGVSKKKGKWEAKVMVNRRWAYRELFDSEEEAARAYDRALWRLKPKEAHSYVNFKDEVPPEVAGLVAEGGASASHAPRHTRHGSRGARLSSEEEEEEEAGSDGSEEFSEEEGSGGTPQRPSWAARGAARSNRRPGLRGSVPAPGRVASAPDLRAAQQQSASPPAQQAQQMQQAQQAAQQVPSGPSGPGFVAMPGGGLQLQFGGSAGAPDGPAAALFAAAPPAAPELQAGPLQLPGALPGAGQPLLVRVGSETHLIPHQQQQPAAAAPGGAGLAAGSTLGKRMSRIQSEPSFAFVKEEASGSLGGDLGDLMNDRDLFKAFELGPETGAPGLVGGSAAGSGAAGGQGLAGLDLDTTELLDFIKDMPDAPVHHGGGGGLGGGGARSGAGMFKSRSMGNLMDLSAPFFDEEDAALAAMEFARPRKISKSMSASQLAGMEAQGGASGRPPLPPPSGSADKLGPLGKPIRRTNTFSSSLAVLQEHHTEGGRASEELAPAPQGPGLSSGHGSGDDLVQRLLSPSPGLPTEDDPVASMLADL